jgi:hypothetical protein
MNRVPALANQDGNQGKTNGTSTSVNGTSSTSAVDAASDEK